jgi:hypothetical protein
MIAANGSTDNRVPGIEAARARFSDRFAELQAKAKVYFRDYKPEAQDEAVAKVFFLTWHYFLALVKRGRNDDSLLTSAFYFSCRQTRCGRKLRTIKHDHSRELFDHAPVVTGINLDAYVSRHTNVADIVAFRLDTRTWFDSLPDRQQRRAIELSEGYTTGECARRWGVTPGAVSICRQQLNQSYRQFIDC